MDSGDTLIRSRVELGGSLGVQSVQFIARLKCALVEDVRDLQVAKLAGLLGDSL